VTNLPVPLLVEQEQVERGTSDTINLIKERMKSFVTMRNIAEKSPPLSPEKPAESSPPRKRSRSLSPPPLSPTKRARRTDDADVADAATAEPTDADGAVTQV
jgi:hypothetical protein